MSLLSQMTSRLFARNLTRVTEPASLNDWREAFCRWNAQRLGISLEESLSRYRRSRTVFRSGFGDSKIREFHYLSLHG